jgi:prepilin-type N-terminal cleavage/methylation domain-containing protein
MTSKLVRRMRLFDRDQRGMTLTELMVSVAMMAIVATIFMTVLLSIQQAVIRQQARSEINDEARLAVEQMDREIRSGSVLYNPATEPAASCGGKDCQPAYSLRVFTQANAPTRIPPEQCVQWVIDGNKLFRRAWESGASASLSGWRMVAEGVVNREPSVSVPAFALPSADSKVLDITLVLNSRFGAQGAPPNVRMNTSVAIRNTGTGDPCSPIPST